MLVEVWRPARAEGRRRPRERFRERRKPLRTETPAAAAAAEHGAGEPQAQNVEAPVEQAAGSAFAKRPPRHRRRPEGEHRRERPDSPRREQERRPPRPARFDRREREKEPDPNSPFAKLAGLKAQLEAEAKERR
jgi:ATP-dependent RNA helicase SUPV3L1/SUV3